LRLGENHTYKAKSGKDRLLDNSARIVDTGLSSPLFDLSYLIVISLSNPLVRDARLVDTGEGFVDLGEIDDLVLVDRTRKFVSNPSSHFLKVRAGVAARLADASQALTSKGLRLLVREGYRPLSLQRAYFDRRLAQLEADYPSTPKDRLIELTSRYAAPPEVAAHPTGAAVDLTLATFKGVELDMGSVFNATDEESFGACYTACQFISRNARENRQVLAQAMESVGFVNYPSEWWHWSYGDRYWAVISEAQHALYGAVEEENL
jgi:zinc D-Ala-D-Ala dipeptidase